MVNTVAKPLITDQISGAKSQNDSEVAIGFSEVAHTAWEVTDVQLVATLYYNQGYASWQEKDYYDSTVSTVKALHLDPKNENAWGNLLGAMNNIAINFAKESRYDMAEMLFEQIALLDPSFADLKPRQVYVYEKWISQLAEEGDIEGAQKVYNKSASVLPNNAKLKKLINSVSAVNN
ncbi:MAG: hypothetical protein ACRC2T_09235 [Thermoguttaceae bacterium]